MKNQHHCFENKQETPNKQSRQMSNNSKNQAKFLKRKPDSKKIFFGSNSIKKKVNEDQIEQRNSEYYVNSPGTLSPRNEEENIVKTSLRQLQAGIKYLSFRESALSEIKSEKNFDICKKQQSRISNICLHKATSETSDTDYLFDNPISTKTRLFVSIEHKDEDKAAQLKKSKTEFFNLESYIHSEEEFSNDRKHLTCLKQSNQQQQKLRSECSRLQNVNLIFQKDIVSYQERNISLETQNKHLIDLIFEKDKVIEKILKASKMSVNSSKKQVFTKEIQKISLINSALNQEIQQLKNQNIKLKAALNKFKENIFEKEVEIDNYLTQLEAQRLNFSKEISLSRKKIVDQQYSNEGRLKNEKYMENMNSFDNNLEVMKKYQHLKEEHKYMLIKNRSLQKNTEKMIGLEKQVQKVKEERDYFKKKVMANIKRMNQYQKYESEGSSLFDLSIQIDQ